LIGDSAENEAPIWFQVIVLEKLAASLKRQVSPVHEIFVKGIALSIDIVNSVAIFAINNKQHVWQRIRGVGVVSHRERIEFGLRFNRAERARRLGLR
jgi:hypothetical protein